MPLKSQWDFGELFPPEATRRVWNVSELTASIRRVLEQNIGHVWLTGEITNFRVQSSGHAYFAIKDASAQIACVLFRNDARGVQRDLLQDGQRVIVQGDITVYEARGQYQLRVLGIELQGIGALQAAFERLKQKLQAEGLFAAERKRALPRFSEQIGIVTSPDGAALRDVIHVIERRHPSLRLVIAPCRVQGAGASDEIAEAIRRLNEWSTRVQLRGGPGARPPLDAILVTRGGGSLEDLWAFNEEAVARAIFDSALPVVSAVGHEIDFTISDFVADVRAATPSAAAEILTEGAVLCREFVQNSDAHLRDLVRDLVRDEAEELAATAQRLARAHPRRRLIESMQRVDDLQDTLVRCAHRHFEAARTSYEHLFHGLLRSRPTEWIAHRREWLQALRLKLGHCTRTVLKEQQANARDAENRLRLLSPLNVLERGYSITMDAATGKVVRRSDDVVPGQKLRTRVGKGEVRSTVDPKEQRA